ncbi:unnamed protein product [Phyllotreta striolata]|uniref:Uncharacterized protein n=1 Tax=Phyllotreta striolata TaxID=444603 RepID=A0A9N9TFR3_PHYSR|nr:unnamed protein product [Phyllotreta striolata]
MVESSNTNLSPDDVVISGMSGYFPNSRNIEEYSRALYNKQLLVTPNRIKSDIPDFPKRMGTLRELDQYDAGNFGAHWRIANFAEPTLRFAYMAVYEAILDAGMNPSDLQNRRVGFFSAACMMGESEVWLKTHPKRQFPFYGLTRYSLGARMSYIYKTKGPVVSSDSACSSSTNAIDLAFKELNTDNCDTAFVIGCNSCLREGSTLQFLRLGVLNTCGICRSFDAKANGYVRAEAVCVLVLQKARLARRVYAQVVAVKSNCDGYKEQGITYPSGDDQRALFEETFGELGAKPESLSYIEAHGTGTTVGDPEECAAIDSFFCKNRKTPLPIGSVKSSIGHTEPASGVCSVVKVLLSFETGFVSPNVNFDAPNPKITSIVDGRLKVITDTMKIEEDLPLVAINNFGFGGSNVHLLLRPFQPLRIKGDDIETPRLVFVSGRSEEAVDCLLDDIRSHLDVDQIKLYHSIFCKYLPSHAYRGYTIVSKTGELQRALYTVKALKVPPLVLSFGEYASWEADFHRFMSVPTFSETIRRAERILGELKPPLNEAILGRDGDARRRYSIAGGLIAQAALADALKALNMNVKVARGRSYGMLIRAYYDDDLTLEQVVRAGLVLNEHVNETASPKMGQPVSSKEVELAFNTNRNGLVKNLRTVLPKALSDGFIDEILKRNHEMYGKSIETQCVIFEIGESNLKDAIKTFENVQLYNFRDFQSFLECLGNLYFVGHSSSLDRLYPKIEFPVRRGTPMISSKIKFNKKKWWIFEETMMTGRKANKFYHVDTTKVAWQYVTGHVIDGRNLFPASGYLHLVWNSLTGWGLRFQSIVFEDCRFIRATTLNNQGVSFKIQFSPSGRFEISEGGSLVVSGKMFINKDGNEPLAPLRPPPPADKVVTSKDIYKELRLRGYNYSGGFRGLRDARIDGTASTVVFKHNWVTFLDNLFQLKILSQDSRQLYVPTFIEKITINCNEFFKEIKADTDDEQLLEAFYCKDTDCIRTLGVEIKGLHASAIQRRKNLRIPVLESYDFVPNHDVRLSYEESMRVNTQIVLENSRFQSVKVVEIVDEETAEEPTVLSEMIVQSFQDQPLIQANATVLSPMTLTTTINVENRSIEEEKDCELIVASKLLQRPELLKNALNSLKTKGFLISREPLGFNPKSLTDDKITLVTTHHTDRETLVLLNKTETKPPATYVELDDEEEFAWLPQLQATMKESNNVVVYSQNDPTNGILGFTNCLVREPGCGHVRCVAILDDGVAFEPSSELFANQLRKNLTVNVYKNGRWGTYRHLLLDEDQKTDNEHYLAKIMVRGDLSTFKWVQGPLSLNAPLKADETLVRINYSSINFKDIMTATAKLNLDSVRTDRFQDTIEGFEFSGVDQKGRRVMGLKMGGLSNMVAADVHFTFPVPDDWTLKEAASVPSVYSTVVFAVFMSGRMQKGDSILIHSGSGGVGQAAIHLCLRYGCEVFTTCGTAEKKEFLLKKFPGLKRSHVGNSRDTTFERMVLRETDGKGVDLVINSLSDEKLMASVRCLATGGRFLEIGKYDLGNNTPLDLLLLEKEASFHSICLDNYFYQTTPMKEKLKNLLNDCIKQGLVKPLDVTVFDVHDIEQAFRFMTSGKHMGKVLIEIQPEGAPLKQIVSNPRWFCTPNKSYVILGGLGGFGLELADWLILRGATHLVLSSRSGPKNGYQMSRVRRWRDDYGVAVLISRADVSTKQGCEELIAQANAAAPVGAVFNLAVVLRDAIFDNQSMDSFKTSFAPKARAARYLDEITRRSCPELEHFVIFSSVSCGRGNAGQTNYGMANSVMERICEQRRSIGLPAVAIQWGAIGDVGLVADSREDDGKEIAIGGSLQQKLSSCLQVMDLLLTQGRSAVVSSVVVAEKRSAFGGENMSEAIANILGLDLKTVQNTQTLAELGMDSMTTVEIKQMLEREQGVFLSAKDIRTLTFGRIKELEEEKSNSDKQGQNEDIVGKSISYLLEAVTKDSPMQVQLQLESNAPAGDAKVPEIIMIPGIEGITTILEPLAKKLDARVTAFQFDFEHPADNVPDMIQNEIEYIQSNFDRSKPVCIVAHSSGTMLALEIVHRLEQIGYQFNLICCDGSTTFTKQLLPSTTDGDFDTAFLLRSLDYFLTLEIKEAIMQKTTLSEKTEVACDLIAPMMKITKEQLKKLLGAFMKRGKAFNDFDGKYSLKSKVTLLKASTKVVAALSDDYNLGEYCGAAVQTIEIEGDHVSMLYNDRVAAFINSVALN